jgi:endo-alpha-1,4-polygalactosaminidase (GH114 family)
MKFGLSIITAALLLTSNVESRWTPKPGLTWSYGIALETSDILSRPEDVITIDYQKGADVISKLHSKGKKVICYFSGGTIEPHRDDKDAYYNTPNLVVEGKTRWDENWLNFRNEAVYPLIRKRIQRAVKENCDALEIDCLGAFNHEQLTTKYSGKPYTKEDSFKFAKKLSKMAHEEGISIGLKNVATIAPQLVNDFDFAVVESCSMSKNVCALYKDFPKQGKAVFTIHYGNYGSFSSQVSTMVKEQNGYGYTCTFNDDDNLKHPGYSYNCDNGSKSGTSGSVPKVQNNPKTDGNPSTSNTGVKTSPGTVNNGTKSASGAVNSGTKSAPGASGAPGTQGAQGAPLNGSVPKGIIPGVSTPALGVNATVTSTASVGAVPGATTAPLNAGATVPGADTSKSNVSTTEKAVENEDDSHNVGTTVALISLGGVATAAAAFFLVKKSKKYKKTDTDYTQQYYSNEAVLNFNEQRQY